MLLLLVYSGAIVLNLARGRRDIDCGCAGPARRQGLHEMLVVRNAAYVALAFAATLPSAVRALGWLDFFTVAAGALALTTLSLAVDELAAIAPRSLELVRRT